MTTSEKFEVLISKLSPGEFAATPASTVRYGHWEIDDVDNDSVIAFGMCRKDAVGLSHLKNMAVDLSLVLMRIERLSKTWAAPANLVAQLNESLQSLDKKISVALVEYGD